MPKVFQLLLVLLENHGRIVEKDELMNQVWAESFVEESNLTFISPSK
jgi:DNA-binding winged helix-turn-helix (wHTH) protein